MRGFDYGPRFGSLLICALFMWLLSVLSAVAATVDREAKTRFGFVLLEGQAATFFGVCSVLLAAGAAWILTRTEPDSIRKKTLTPGPDGIELNRSGLNPQSVSAPYDRIQGLRHVRNRKQEHLRIKFDGGVLSLDRLLFDDRAAFPAFKTTLEERITLP